MSGTCKTCADPCAEYDAENENKCSAWTDIVPIRDFEIAKSADALVELVKDYGRECGVEAYHGVHCCIVKPEEVFEKIKKSVVDLSVKADRLQFELNNLKGAQTNIEVVAKLEKANVDIKRLQRAKRTLELIGYEDKGGELWKPPIGGIAATMFAEIERIAKERDKLIIAVADHVTVRAEQREQLAALAETVQKMREAMQLFLDSHEECEGFDGFTAQIVSMDDYHEAQEALALPDKSANVINRIKAAGMMEAAEFSRADRRRLE